MADELINLFTAVEDAASGGDLLAEFFQNSAEMDKHAAVMALLYDVEQAGGTAPVETLQALGHKDGALAAALTQPDGDKRARALLRPYNLGGVRVVALTSSGWTALGKANKREQRPTPQGLTHRLAPLNIKRHIEGKARAWAPRVEISVDASSHGINAWQDNLSARAWAHVTGNQTDGDGTFGQLTRREGCPRPDALIVETWPDGGWHQTWSETQPNGHTPAYAERVLLLEVETAEKREAALGRKVDRLNAAVALGAADYVLWCVDDASMAVRINKAVGASAMRTSADVANVHRYVTLPDMTGSGLPPTLPVGAPTWWVARH